MLYESNWVPNANYFLRSNSFQISLHIINTCATIKYSSNELHCIKQSPSIKPKDNQATIKSEPCLNIDPPTPSSKIKVNCFGINQQVYNHQATHLTLRNSPLAPKWTKLLNKWDAKTCLKTINCIRFTIITTRLFPKDNHSSNPAAKREVSLPISLYVSIKLTLLKMGA